MRLIFLYGPPACGKLTVARCLHEITGYRIFHNHLVVDALLAVFDFGSASFVALRERLWIEVMGAAAASGVAGIIFTFAPERTVRDGFVERLRRRIEASAGEVVFVRLDCADDEIERRLGAASRRGTGKLTSVEQYRELRRAGAFARPVMPAPALAVDTSTRAPQESAALIAAHLDV